MPARLPPSRQRKSRGSPRDSTPLVARLEPYRSRFRAGFGTLLALCRLPGGRRARTLAPLLIEGQDSTRWGAGLRNQQAGLTLVAVRRVGHSLTPVPAAD